MLQADASSSTSRWLLQALADRHAGAAASASSSAAAREQQQHREMDVPTCLEIGTGRYPILELCAGWAESRARAGSCSFSPSPSPSPSLSPCLSPISLSPSPSTSTSTEEAPSSERWKALSLFLYPGYHVTGVGRRCAEIQVNHDWVLPFDAASVGCELRIPHQGLTPQLRWKRDKSNEPQAAHDLFHSLFDCHPHVSTQQAERYWNTRRGSISLARVRSPLRQHIKARQERWHLSGETSGSLGPGLAWALLLDFRGHPEGTDFATPLVCNLLARLRQGAKPSPDARRLLTFYVQSCLHRRLAIHA